MRSTITWVVAAAAAVTTGLACSDEDSAGPSVSSLPNQPGSGGSAGMMMSAPAPAPGATPPGMETPPVVQPPAMQNNGQSGAAVGSGGSGGAGAAGAGGAAVVDAGAPPAPDAGGDDDPPAEDEVGFSDVFPLLVASCGDCHGANSPPNRPLFARAGDEATSYAATQAMGNGGTVAERIIARAVTLRTMPPQCMGQAFGTGLCLDAGEAALLQAWLDQGAQP